MAMAEPWQKAEIPGPVRALVITKPEVVVALLKRAERPILVVGHEAAEAELGLERGIDLAIRVSEAGRIPVVATAHTVREFKERGFQTSGWMPVVDIANRLKDPSWRGLDGGGQYDLALFMGIPYYMEWLVLSGLKHFSPNLKSISLDRYYQPHASWSFPNLSKEEWQKSLEAIIEKLGEE